MIRNKQRCFTCKWYQPTTHTCVCPDSDYLGTVTDLDYWCMEWEREKTPESLPNDLLLGQIAEECAELIHAIEKFRRTGTANPTPVSPSEAWKSVLEEVADVKVVTDTFMRKLPDKAYEGIWETVDRKYERWCRRLND